MTHHTLQLFVPGTPTPQGSKRGIPIRRKNGKMGVALLEMGGQRLHTWRDDIRAAASYALADNPDWHPTNRDPIKATLAFYMPRPKSHYRTGRNAHLLRDTAPTYPTTKPDIDKLQRAIFDALTSARVYPDDAQVIWVTAQKFYADGIGQCVMIEISYPKQDTPCQ